MRRYNMYTRSRLRPSVFLLLLLFIPTISFAISAPQNVRGTEVSQFTVKWEWNPVVDASEYELTIDGNTIVTTGNTQYTSSNLWSGDHSLTVKSIGSDAAVSTASDTGKIVVRASYDPDRINRSFTVVHSSGNSAPPTVQNAAEPSSTDQNTTEQSTAEPVLAPALSGIDDGLIDPQSLSIAGANAKPGYQLVFSDEFNGQALNPRRWNAQLRWDGEFNGERYEYRVINGEDQFYVNTLSDDRGHIETAVPAHNPFEFDGSRLAIRAVRNPLQLWQGEKSHGSLMDIISQQTFLSGAISTFDKFTQKYGYFEARIKIPSHVGTFPAFWLHHQKRAYEGTRKSEIDIMENLGHAPWYIYNSFHYYDNVSANYGGNAKFLKPRPEGQIYTGTDYSEDYHTYSVEWEPGRVTWFIDGQQVSELVNSNVDHEELYIILNLAMGGNWTNFPTNSGGLGRTHDNHFPNSDDLSAGKFNNPALEIDYVRAYKRN